MYSRRDCARSWSGMRTGQYVCAWMLEGHQGLPYTRNAQPQQAVRYANIPGIFRLAFFRRRNQKPANVTERAPARAGRGQ